MSDLSSFILISSPSNSGVKKYMKEARRMGKGSLQRRKCGDWDIEEALRDGHGEITEEGQDLMNRSRWWRR